MSVLRVPFVLGLVVGLCLITLLSAASAQQRADLMTPQMVGEASWGYMTADQRRMVDQVAADLYRSSTTPYQRQTMTGHPQGAFIHLPTAYKTTYRGQAILRLGYRPEDFRRQAI